MNVSNEQIISLVENIWSSMLGLDISVSNSVLSNSDDKTTVGATIQITGPSKACVMLLCSLEYSKYAAAAMLGMSQDEISEEEAFDAIGELANMVGGSIKEIMGSQYHISLPTIAVGKSLHLTSPGGVVVNQIAFGENDLMITATLIEST